MASVKELSVLTATFCGHPQTQTVILLDTRLGAKAETGKGIVLHCARPSVIVQRKPRDVNDAQQSRNQGGSKPSNPMHVGFDPYPRILNCGFRNAAGAIDENGPGLTETPFVVRRQVLIEITEIPSCLGEAEAGRGESGTSNLAASEKALSFWAPSNPAKMRSNGVYNACLKTRHLLQSMSCHWHLQLFGTSIITP